jgi:hypothetical protein
MLIGLNVSVVRRVTFGTRSIFYLRETARGQLGRMMRLTVTTGTVFWSHRKANRSMANEGSKRKQMMLCAVGRASQGMAVVENRYLSRSNRTELRSPQEV